MKEVPMIFGRQWPNHGSCQSWGNDNTGHVVEVGHRRPGVLMVLNHWKCCLVSLQHIDLSKVKVILLLCQCCASAS